jgi:predicted ABC-type ATPase
VPTVAVVAGPNGAGKSTTAPALLRDTLGITEFVNADEIARGLSAFAPERAAIPAGRVMLDRLDELAAAGADFAFETTLSGRAYAEKIGQWQQRGFQCHLYYFWLPDADLAVHRVQERVRLGGHNIPEVDIRRRYVRSLRNFFRLYRPLVESWRFYDNGDPIPRLIAHGGHDTESAIDAQSWERIVREYGHASEHED